MSGMLIILSSVLSICIYGFLKNIKKLYVLTSSTTSIKKIIGITKIGKEEEDLSEKIVREFEIFIKKYIFKETSEEKKKKVIEKMKRAGINDTYEKYLVKKYLYPLLILLVGLFIGLLTKRIPLISLISSFLGVVCGFLMIFDADIEINKQHGRKNEMIILEMPRFIRTYRYSPKEKGFHLVVDDYLKSSKDGLRYDLEILKTDIEMFGENKALTNFAQRINIAEINELVTVILNSFKGEKNNTDTNLSFVEAKFINLSEDILDKEIEKRPEILDTVNMVLLNSLGLLFLIPMLLYTVSGLQDITG